MWRYLWLCPVYLLIASFPFFFDIGRNLEYEYTLMVSFLALSFIPMAALLTPAELIPYQNGYAPFFVFDIYWIFLISPLIALLPALFVFLVGLCPCSRTGYMFWMIVQVYPAWILAHAIYHGVIWLRCYGWSKLKLLGVLILIPLVMALILGLYIWFSPQVRITQIYFGFIHGPIYDNLIAVDSGIILARVSQLLFGMTVLSFFFGMCTRVKYKPAIFVGSIWLILAVWAEFRPSVRMGSGSLNKILPETVTSDFFAIHYTNAYEAEADSNLSDIQTLFQETFFHVTELRRLFPDAPFVHIYVYPNQRTKKLWFGAGTTDVADVHTPSVHITTGPSPHATLRHELVHALSSNIGFYGLGFHPNMAFTEGLAVALAPEDRPISLHQGAAALIRSGRLPDIGDLFSPMFWKESGRRAYTVSGSIILFLKDYYGIDKVKMIYAGKSWEKTFGSSRINTLRKWRDFILQNYDHQQSELFTEALFRYPGVFMDKCPHSKADYRQPRESGVFLRLRQPLGWDPIEDYWPWRVRLDKKDRYAQLALWSDEIKKAVERRGNNKGRFRTWKAALSRARVWPPQSIEDIKIALKESDLTRILEGSDASLKLLYEIEKYAKTKYVGDSLLRQIQARISIEKKLPSYESLEWRKYLAGWRTDTPNQAGKSYEPWLVTYLRLRKGDRQILNESRLLTLMKTPLNISYADTFKVEWYKFLGIRFLQLKNYAAAEQAFSQAAAMVPASLRRYYAQEQRRAQFYRNYSSKF